MPRGGLLRRAANTLISVAAVAVEAGEDVGAGGAALGIKSYIVTLDFSAHSMAGPGSAAGPVRRVVPRNSRRRPKLPLQASDCPRDRAIAQRLQLRAQEVRQGAEEGLAIWRRQRLASGEDGGHGGIAEHELRRGQHRGGLLNVRQIGAMLRLACYFCFRDLSAKTRAPKACPPVGAFLFAGKVAATLPPVTANWKPRRRPLGGRW